MEDCDIEEPAPQRDPLGRDEEDEEDEEDEMPFWLDDIRRDVEAFEPAQEECPF
jgi:hypothetical protein